MSERIIIFLLYVTGSAFVATLITLVYVMTRLTY